ncbi:MAG TPA: hypothetical protein VK920_07165 [Solirubrobacterales bacterium]|nr:hypothetical protein [Solirubrobacterales bacterium]
MSLQSDTGAHDAALAPAGGARVPQSGGAARIPDWLPAVALSSALAAILLVWDPQVRDLAAQAFRVELFEREGFAIWNGSWYEGHYTLTYSVLFPPLAALLGPQLVGALSVVASAYLFDRLVRDHWGKRARWATLWFGAGAVTMMATGRITFSLGVAFGLAALRALQCGRRGWAIAAAGACALSSPVAAVFLAGIAGVGALTGPGRVNRVALVAAAVAAVPIVVLNLVFPDESRQPFSFAAFFPVLLYLAVVLYITRGSEDDRRFRAVVIAYVLATTLVWLVPNPLGNNAIRLPALFGGPLLLAIMLARRPRVPTVVAVLILATAAFWQFLAPVRDVAQSAGDASTKAGYYNGLEDWLRAHGGKHARIEVPTTLNTWEAAYLAPEFQLARGWLGQLDRARNGVFYDGRLTHERYRSWLRRNGVRYVALPDAPLQPTARRERRLIRDEPAYLQPRWSSAHWSVYEVADPLPLVRSEYGHARLLSLSPDSFTLEVERPGTFTVLARPSPYWELDRGDGCVGRDGRWTSVTVRRPGRVKAEVGFSMGGALRSAARSEASCVPALPPPAHRGLRGL